MTAKLIDFKRKDEDIGVALDRALGDFANLIVGRRIDRSEAVNIVTDAFNEAFDQAVEIYRLVDQVIDEEQEKRRAEITGGKS